MGRRTSLCNQEIRSGSKRMDLNQTLMDLFAQATSICGRQLDGKLMVEVALWRRDDRRMHWTCVVIDAVDADTKVELAFGFGPTADVAVALCAAQLEMRRWGFLRGMLGTA